MGIIIRQSIKSSIFLYLAVAIGVINRLFLLPYYLTFEQLGLIDVLLGVSILVSEISYLGTKGVVNKFFSSFDMTNKLPVFIGSIFTIAITGFSINCMFLILLKGHIVHLFPKNIELFNQYYNYIYPIALCFVVKGLLTAFSTNKLRITIPTILNEVLIKSFTMLGLVLIGFSIIDFNNFLLLITFGYITVTLLIYVYCKKWLSFRTNLKLNRISKIEYKEMAKYASFVILIGLSNIVSQYTDSIMLGSIKGLDVSGIYSIAFFIGLSIEMPKRAITSISIAIVSKHWNDKQPDKIHKLYKQSSINQGIVGCLLFLLIWFNLDEIFYLLPKSNTIIIAKNVTLIIGFSRIIDMLTGVNSEILRTSNAYYIEFYLLIFFILFSVFSNILLIPLFNMEGAAIATLSTVFLYNLARYLILKLKYKFDPFSIKTIWLLIVFSIFSLTIMLIPPLLVSNMFENVVSLIIKSMVLISLFSIIVYKLKISPELNDLLKKILKLPM